MGMPAAAQNIISLFGLFQTSNYRRRQRNQFLPQIKEKVSSSNVSEQQQPGNIITNQKLKSNEHHQAVELDQEPELKELNCCLEKLATIFPDVRIEVFREMILACDEESRLAVVTEALLKHKTKWVKGRYKSANKDSRLCMQDEKSFTCDFGQVPVQEKFRSSSYKKSVKEITYQEFRGLSRSTINGILNDYNFSYIHARPTLLALSSKTWRFSLSALFKRRKSLYSSDLAHHPLVIWQPAGQEFLVPSLKSSGCQELDQELFESLLNPLKKQAIAEQEEKDYKIALDISITEAGQNESLHDCECCFTSSSFEGLTACEGGHFICFRCIKNSLQEAIYSNGWQMLINLERGSLRCVAAISHECSKTIPIYLVYRALEKEKTGKSLLRRLDERLAEENMLRSNLPLIRCPFCNYAEVDELYVPESKKSYRLKCTRPFSFHTVLIFLLGVCMIPCLFLLLLSCSMFSLNKNLYKNVVDQFNSSTNRIRRKHIGLKFQCKNKYCGRATCRHCLKEWIDIHICHESSLQDLRTFVELAMSDAIKRTCPRCNTSFIKTSGCNKLTCVCGYQMCYICRKDIGNGEGYLHFCEHFRPSGGKSCSECMKCDLYRCEEDEAVARKAKREAEIKWMKKEERLLNCDDKFRKVLEQNWKQVGDISLPERKRWRLPNKEYILDMMVESLIFVK
ncbi:putative ring finger protein [Erysiphe neolycopersici]|uniref:Putative ring finger protein n=1 Tax=Erysiphe neolycopersici TaxID=212602 RepID=A0A420HUN9_9PEZI|nr:putative ring finger protein [Erysiphe neolycopersici]